VDVWVPWLQSLLAIALAFAAAAFGRGISRFRWWPLASIAACGLIGCIGAARWFPRLELMPPFAWLTHGRTEYMLLAPLVAIALGTPAARVDRRGQRVLTVAFLAVIVGQYSVLPFLMPALVHERLAGLVTAIDSDGVCHQSTPYTCGPAAAVTALRRLGITDATESDLAIGMCTSPTLGTPPDVLAATLDELYRSRGLRSRYVAFDSVTDLTATEGLVIAVVKYSLMVDHYVTVMHASPDRIVIGDPAGGAITVRPDEFAKRWRFMGILITKNDKSREVDSNHRPAAYEAAALATELPRLHDTNMQ
jgi:predicted double-glycine peptidase